MLANQAETVFQIKAIYLSSSNWEVKNMDIDLSFLHFQIFWKSFR